MTTPSVVHLLRELARLDAALEIQVARFRAGLGDESGDEDGDGDDMSAFYVSDAEADLLLRTPADATPGASSEATVDAPPEQPLPVDPARAGGWPRLDALAAAFDLAEIDLDTLLICLAPEVDRRYERLYGYLQDDITRRLPSVALILDLTCLDLPTRLYGRTRFAPPAPLLHHRLVGIGDPPGGTAVSLLDGMVRLEPRVARFLLEDATGPEVPARWSGGVQVVVPDAEPDGDGAARLAEAAVGSPLLLCPLGDPEQASAAVAVFAARRGQPLLHVLADRFAGLPDGEFRQLLAEIGREVRLTGAAVLLSGVTDPVGARAEHLAGWAVALPGPVVVTGPAQLLAALLPGGVRVDLPVDPVLVRRSARRRLHGLAQLVPPRHGWSDLVLPEARTERLRELADVARFRATVLDDWGFGASVASGPGINVLFAGPSGTGKTMAAQVIARELDRDLFAVDLAAMVSKYIGETEKNLDAVFAAVGDGECVLFFDEADALFGKRTAVKDAHDRYANLQTSYLLQKLEEHTGVVVLATNLRKNMDEAFVRRLHSVIEFPVPRVEERRGIWRQIWPAAAPLAPDLDTEVLAARIELSGGHLRNIAVGAAFLAAADGGVITMAHLERATRREYQQLGKIATTERDGSWSSTT